MDKITKLFNCLYPKFIWEMPPVEKVIYLTFDDGPIPEVTPFVLEILDKYNAEATFFCVGQNIEKHPDVFKQVIEKGHAVGNHTHSHIKGWRSPVETYIADFKNCDEQLSLLTDLKSKKLFRPPYGRITRKQAKVVRNTHEIIMWSVLTKDYDARLSPEQCLERAIKATESGAIVLFHDSLKAQKNMRYALPQYLAHFSALGYRFKALHFDA
jgi:peptidoglycan-N-acetylglucosamine deacetylase